MKGRKTGSFYKPGQIKVKILILVNKSLGVVLANAKAIRRTILQDDENAHSKQTANSRSATRTLVSDI